MEEGKEGRLPLTNAKTMTNAPLKELNSKTYSCV